MRKVCNTVSQHWASILHIGPLLAGPTPPGVDQKACLPHPYTPAVADGLGVGVLLIEVEFTAKKSQNVQKLNMEPKICHHLKNLSSLSNIRFFLKKSSL